jgi:hypothetical protein
VRNRLCHRRSIQTAPRPFSRNRDAQGKHINLWRYHSVQSGISRTRIRTKGFSKSFGGRLAQIRAIQAWNSERRAWSSAEEFDRGGCAHAGPEDKRAPSPRAVFRVGRGRGEWGVAQCGKCFFLKSLLHLTVFKIN